MWLRAVVVGVVASFAAGCGELEPPQRPAPRPAPTEEELRSLERQAGVDLFWLGESFAGRRLARAEDTRDGVSLAYGPESCSGDSGCVDALSVDTMVERQPDHEERSCWHRVARAWLDWCGWGEEADLYTGDARVSIFTYESTPHEVAEAVRRFPRRRASSLPAPRRFSCAEADGFRGKLPVPLRPRDCG